MILAKKKQKENCRDKHKEIQYKRISGIKIAFQKRVPKYIFRRN